LTKRKRQVRVDGEFQPQIDKALIFVNSLGENNGESYYEVAEVKDLEYRIYKQSQYLLSILFKTLGRDDLFRRIRKKHRPNDFDNDKNRKWRRANDRYCVLEGDTIHFNTSGVEAESSDGIALLALHCLNMKSLSKKVEEQYRLKAKELWNKLLLRYDPSRGVLAMDRTDKKNNLYSVYKVAFLGILAKKMSDGAILSRVRQDLIKWQQESNRNGGWITDLKPDSLELIGLANVETTALCVLALVL